MPYYRRIESKRDCASQTGFTLLEVMIAMAILSVGILALSALQIRSINQNAAARMQTEATALAAQHMELLKTLPYDHDLLSADADRNPHEQITGAYRLQWTVTTPAVGDPVYDGLPVKIVELAVGADNPNAKPVRVNFIRGQGES